MKARWRYWPRRSCRSFRLHYSIFDARATCYLMRRLFASLSSSLGQGHDTILDRHLIGWNFEVGIGRALAVIELEAEEMPGADHLPLLDIDRAFAQGRAAMGTGIQQRMDAVAATDDRDREIIIDHEAADAAILEFIETTDRNPRHIGSPRMRSFSRHAKFADWRQLLL